MIDDMITLLHAIELLSPGDKHIHTVTREARDLWLEKEIEIMALRTQNGLLEQQIKERNG